MLTQGVCAAMGHARPLTADLADDDGGSLKRIGCCWAPSSDVPTEEDLREGVCGFRDRRNLTKGEIRPRAPVRSLVTAWGGVSCAAEEDRRARWRG